MKPTPRTATAADFDETAQRRANGAWLSLIFIPALWYSGPWWAPLFPAIGLAWFVATSISSARAGDKLRRGTYPIPNPNNGAPDGDARNWHRPNPVATPCQREK